MGIRQFSSRFQKHKVEAQPQFSSLGWGSKEKSSAYFPYYHSWGHSLYQRLKSACVSSSRVLLLKPQCMFQDWHSQGIFASQTPLPFSAMQPITGYAIKLRNKKFFKHIGNIFQLYRTRIHLQRFRKHF